MSGWWIPSSSAMWLRLEKVPMFCHCFSLTESSCKNQWYPTWSYSFKSWSTCCNALHAFNLVTVWWVVSCYYEWLTSVALVAVKLVWGSWHHVWKEWPLSTSMISNRTPWWMTTKSTVTHWWHDHQVVTFWLSRRLSGCVKWWRER